MGGFGTADTYQVSALASFDGRLYASTANSAAGAQVWRCQTCDGTDWTRVVDDGFGNNDNNGPSALEVFEEQLYFVVGNSTTGMEVWRTPDGEDWTQVGFAGFGDSSNVQPWWDNPVTVADGRLYVGTSNQADSGEVWLYLPNRVYLPLAVRNY
jgi:hypothetical protein